MCPRARHSMIATDGMIFNWGGGRLDIPLVHTSDTKRSVTSLIETFDVSSLVWTSVQTTGDPPSAVRDYSSCSVNSNIFIFGGSCLPTDCYHSDLFTLDTLSNKWSQIEYNNSPTTSPMKKRGHGMISFTSNKKDYLMIIGGFGPTPTSTTHSNGECIPHPTIPDRSFTNETHLMCLSSSPSQLYHY